MATFFRYFLRTCAALVIALPVGCVVAGLVTGIFSYFMPGPPAQSLPDAIGSGLVVAIPALLFGWAPALLYGAPVYAFLASRGWANYGTTLTVGVLPSALAWDAFSVIGFLAAYGGAVACLTHLCVGLWVPFRGDGAANLSRPKRHPGALQGGG